MKHLTHGVAVLVSLMFVFIGSVKLFGVPQSMFESQLENYFNAYGLTRGHMFAVGLAELFGAVAIWWHRTRWIGLAGPAVLVVVTLGATYYHLQFDTVREARPAIMMLTLSSFVLLMSWNLHFRVDKSGVIETSPE